MAVVATIAKGYDLDYMWSSTQTSPGRAGEYYISAAEAGEPPGRWWGAGIRALGLRPGQVVERQPYDLLFGERKAPDGMPLGRPPNREAAQERYRRALAGMLAAEPYATGERKAALRIEAAKKARVSPLYMDLTISFSKSISVFHASLTENARLARLAGDTQAEQHWAGLAGEMEEMIYAAVRAGFDYFQREAGYTRTGSHHTRADGRESGQWREAELVVAHWLQHTSRDGDMQLHVHSQIAHVCRTIVDGKWRAPDSLGYHEHIAATGSIVAQHLEEAMTRRFGVQWTPREDGRGFEIAGIPAELLAVFSSRRSEIDTAARQLAERFTARYGRAPSQRELGELRQAANLATRARKPEGAADWDQVSKGWAARLAATLGVSLAAVAPSVSLLGDNNTARASRGGLSHAQLRRAAQMALALAEQEKAAFTRADLVKHLGRVLPRTGLDASAAVRLLEDLADRALACEFGDVACLDAPEPVAVPPDLIRADGRSVYQRHGGARYATGAQLGIEQRLVAQATARGAPCLAPEQSPRLLAADALGAWPLRDSGTARADNSLDRSRLWPSRDVHAGSAAEGTVDRVAPVDAIGGTATLVGLLADQAAVAHAALTSDRRAVVIDAPAGSGKTRVLAAIGGAWADAGLGRVVGVAPSQAARNTLAQAGVAESYNCAQFLGHLSRERGGRGRIPIGPSDLVLVDETSMVSIPDLADLVAYVTERGAKVILAGDLMQLQPVENGGGMRLLASRLGALQLDQPVRFVASWEREASLRLRRGDVSVLADYDAHGRILSGPPEDMLEQAARRYVAHTAQGRDVLLMASDHAHRRELCRRIRGELQYLGLVSIGPSVTVADGQQASPGDLIVCTRNNHNMEAGELGRGLANGDLLRIEHIMHDALMVRRALDSDPRSGQQRWSQQFRYHDYHDAELGYAVTDHAAQSRTVHIGMQLITGSETRQQAYVGLSRGTHANTALVCTPKPSTADARPDPRPAPELARADELAADRAGQTRGSVTDTRDEALSVLAGVLARDGAELSALETREQSFAAASNLAILHAQWQAETGAARTKQWRQVVHDALPEAYRAELSHRSQWLWRTLRTAELAGLDPGEVVATAVGQRNLTGARDIAAVIDARIRRRIAGLVPLPQPGWTARIPAGVRPGHDQYVTGLAAAMDRRTRQIGEQVLEHQPAWAVNALGPIPDDLPDRLAWQRKASTIGAYRELTGYGHPADAIGPEPANADPELRAAWHDAFACLGPPDGPDVRGLSDGQLHLLRDKYEIETAWAPRYVTEAVRVVRLGADDAELEATRRDALAHASAEHGDHHAASANQHLADSYRALAGAYRSRETVLAATDRDRERWEALTDKPLRLALAADAELRRRYPEQTLPPLRSAEPEPVAQRELAELAMAPGTRTRDPGQWIDELAAQHEAFENKLAEAKQRGVQLGLPTFDDINWASPLSGGLWADAILKPPKPDIRRVGRNMGHAATADREPEAGW